MADNVAITAGSGTSIATDDVGGVHVQRVKITTGADGTANDATATNPVPTTNYPNTNGGWTPYSNTALSNTKQTVKGSAGCFGGYMIYNPNTVPIFIQVFDVAAASVTVGTTTPTYVLTIPPVSAANLELTLGVGHANAIVIAATTTATGSTAPTTALTAAIFYE